MTWTWWIMTQCFPHITSSNAVFMYLFIYSYSLYKKNLIFEFLSSFFLFKHLIGLHNSLIAYCCFKSSSIAYITLHYSKFIKISYNFSLAFIFSYNELIRQLNSHLKSITSNFSLIYPYLYVYRGPEV